MRLFLAALIVVGTFALSALLISRLFPYGAGWAGVCLAITCLYASAFAAWALLGKQRGGTVPGVRQEMEHRHPLRDNLLYFSVAIAIVTIVIAVTIHDTERGIHRNFRNDWFVGLTSAGVASGYAAKAFWIFRKNWRLWAAIAALFVLFTLITIPVLSRMGKVPLLLGGPLANVELLVSLFALQWFLGESDDQRGAFRPNC